MPAWVIGLILIIMVIFVLIDLIPIVGFFSDPIGEALIVFIFYTRGVSVSKNKNLFSLTIVLFILGLIPEIGGVIDLIGLFFQIHMIRKEDKKYNKDQAALFAQQQADMQAAQNEEEESEYR